MLTAEVHVTQNRPSPDALRFAGFAGAGGRERGPETFRMEAKPRLRSLPDRLRQIALYEIVGVGLISPLFALAAGISPADSVGLLSMLALIVAVWNGLYSTAFDWVERAITGRRADLRPPLRRAAHAVVLEIGAVVATTPVISAWTNVGWKAALVEDVGLTLVYSGYAFVFGLSYDWLFPIYSAKGSAEVINVY